jgi:23S rRNA pseudouridine1911/1915/1917 synthase
VKEWTLDEAESGARLDTFLARQAEIGSRSRARSAIECGKVLLNLETVAFSDAGRRLKVGDRVRYWEDRPGTAHRRAREIVAARSALSVVFEDDAVLVADKPVGMLVVPLPGEAGREITLLDLVADHLRFATRTRALVVHRIDRDTSGLVLFAKTLRARVALKDQFERRTPERVYVALLQGRVEPASGTWRDKLAWDRERLVQRRAHGREAAAKEAVARYRVLEQYQNAALVEVRLVTGKRNQIRVQAGARGHPLVGERLYTFGAAAADAGAPTLARQALHAARLSFVHPISGERVTVTAPLPRDMQALIDQLRRKEAEQAAGVRQ